MSMFLYALCVYADVFEFMQRSQRASQLLRQAQHVKIEWGSVSRTDKVLHRHFNIKTLEETNELEVLVTVRKDQSELAQALDLTHELVHALSVQHLDPYNPELTAADYMKTTIEGGGGEVEALIAECQALIEFRQQGFAVDHRCAPYILHQKVSRSKILSAYYRTGEWKERVQKRLGYFARHFQYLSSQKPLLYSSTGNTPYPYALLEEFDMLTAEACLNTHKRIENMEGKNELIAGMRLFLLKRCQVEAHLDEPR